jgi:hypothetical protein
MELASNPDQSHDSLPNNGHMNLPMAALPP